MRDGDHHGETRGPPGPSTSLGLWEELAGQLVKMEDEDERLVVELSSGTLVVGAQSPEAAILRTQLEGEDGCIVSILRTDSPDRPLRVTVR